MEVIEEPDVQGELALRPGWPSMFRAYWNDPKRYQDCFMGGFYLTGDLARRDRDGYFWFVGRKDDVIKTSGHLIGPFEVESVLMEHPAVAEAGVIGKPDPVALEVIKAFVALKDGYQPSEDAPPRAAGARPQTARGGGCSQGDRVHPELAEEPGREDHAASAPGQRARTPRRRYLDAGGPVR